MFLDAENFGVDSKYVKIFMDVAQDGTIKYRDKTGTIHTHSLLFQEFQIVKIWEVPLMLVRNWHNNMFKLLSMHYMLGSLICGYSMPLKFSALFLIPWCCHFYIGMHNYDYKFFLIISV